MKKTIHILIAAVVLMGMASAVSSAQAEPEMKGPPPMQGDMQQPPRGGMKGHPPGGPGDELGIPHGKWWQRSNIQKKLNLSKEQIAKLNEIARSGRKNMIKLHAEIELLNVDLEPIIDAKNFDRGAAEKVIGKMEAVRAKMAASRIKMLLDTREVLTSEQFSKLKELKGQRDKKRKASKARGAQRGKGFPGRSRAAAFAGAPRK